MRMTEPREITESFRLDRVLKSSRSGIVFRATELSRGRVAAIKLIAPSCPSDLHICQEQFLEAVEAWRTCRPPAFPELLDSGFTPDGSAFLVMEYVEGVPLDARVEQAPRRLLTLVRDCMNGLAALASHGVYHGNLTPQNLLARPLTEGEAGLVLGFGTAAFRVFMGELTGAVLASDALEFAAPELVDPHAGMARGNARSDMYSLAQVIVRVLGASVKTSAAGEVSLTLPPSVQTTLGEPLVLHEMLARALRPHPEERPESWSELQDGLEKVLAAPIEEAPSSHQTLFLNLGSAPTPAFDLPDAEVPAGSTRRFSTVVEPACEGVDASPEATVPPPLQPDSGAVETTQPLVATPETAPLEPLGQEAERTMAVPVHRLIDLPSRPDDEAPALAPPPPPALSTQEVTPAAFHPSPPPPAMVFESAPPPTGAAALYDTDKGRAKVQPVMPPPLPGGDGQAVVPSPSLPPPPEAVTRLSEAVLEPEPASLPQTPTPGVAARPLTGRVAVPPPATRPRHRSLWPLWLVLAVLVLGGGGVGFLWWQSMQAEQEARRRHVPPTPRPATPVPTVAPKQPPVILAQMRGLEEALAASDLKAAQQALESFTVVDELQLPAADRERLEGLRNSYTELRLGTLGSDLVRGLQSGNLRLVSRTLAALTRDEQTTLARNPDKAQALDEARRAQSILKLAQNAEKSGNWADLLQQASALREVVPRADQAAELREKGAKGLESEATSAAQAGNTQQAIDRLTLLQRLWPDRPGLSARLERLKAEQEAEKQVAGVLAAAEQAEGQRQPERGLALLQSVRPSPRQERAVAELRQRLLALLKQMDARPPKVELQRGAKLEYEKGKMARLPFVITDDHGVKSAKLFARVEGNGRYVEMNLTRSKGDEFLGELTVSFHQNQTVQLFIVATDYSEQTAVLGSADKPLLLKRKKVLGIF